MQFVLCHVFYVFSFPFLFSCSYGFRFLWCLISGVKLLIHRDFTTNVVVLPFMLFSLCASGSTCQLFSPPFCAIIPKYIKACERSLCQPLRRLSKFFSMFRKLAEIFLRHCSPNFPNLYKRYPQSFITNALVTDKRRDDQPNFWYHWRLFFAYSTSWTPTPFYNCMSLLPTVNCNRHNTRL